MRLTVRRLQVVAGVPYDPPGGKILSGTCYGTPFRPKALALLVPVKRCPAPADQGRDLGCGLARGSRLANQLKLLRDKGRVTERLPKAADMFYIDCPLDVAGSIPSKIDGAPMPGSHVMFAVLSTSIRDHPSRPMRRTTTVSPDSA